MNIKHFAAASLVALAPFAYAGQAKAAGSDCWFGQMGEDLGHFSCQVRTFNHPEGGLYWEVDLVDRTIDATLEVVLWEDENEEPTVADLSWYNRTDGSRRDWEESYVIDRDGDVRIRFTAIGRNARDAVFIFRFPDHEYAGTGCAGDGCGGVASSSTPVGYRAGSNGLRQGDLSDTPFRF